MQDMNSAMPDNNGFFGQFGGSFVAETLMPLLLDLGTQWQEAKADPSFWERFAYLSRHYVGRPSPLYFAERLTAAL